MSLKKKNNTFSRRSLQDRFPDMVVEARKLQNYHNRLEEEAKKLSIDDFVENYGSHNLQIWWRVNKEENKMKGETNDNS